MPRNTIQKAHRCIHEVGRTFTSDGIVVVLGIKITEVAVMGTIRHKLIRERGCIVISIRCHGGAARGCGIGRVHAMPYTFIVRVDVGDNGNPRDGGVARRVEAGSVRHLVITSSLATAMGTEEGANV